MAFFFMPVCLFAMTSKDCAQSLEEVRSEHAGAPLWQSHLNSPKEFEKIFGIRHLTINEMTASQRGQVSSYLSEFMYPPATDDMNVDNTFDSIAADQALFDSYQNAINTSIISDGFFPSQDLTWVDFLTLYVPYIHGAHPISPKPSDPMISPRISIKKINDSIGLGVFAEEDIHIGAWIGEYTGVVSQSSDDPKLNEYDMEYAVEGLSLRAKDAGNFTRFINHSKNENVEPQGIIYKQQLFIGIIANRNIKRGEQILYDYGSGYWQ